MRATIPRVLVLGALILGALAISGSVTSSPPLNDDFDSATVITDLPYSDSISTVEATMADDDPTEACNDGASVWYAYTPSHDQAITADTYGSDYPTALAVFTGARGALSLVECVDRDWSPSITLHLSAGTTYYFEIIDVEWVDGGNLAFNIDAIAPPENDDFAEATVIDPSSLPFSVQWVDNTGATTEPGEPAGGGCGTQLHTVWYSVTPTSDMPVMVDADTTVNAYRAIGSGIGDLSFLGCGTYRFSRDLEAENTYYFQVGSDYRGSEDFNFAFGLRPPNDDFADAELISSLPFTDSGDISYANTESDEPLPVGQQKTVWYSFTPTVRTMVNADPAGSSWDTDIHIYHASGTGFAGLTELASAQWGSSVMFTLQADETYYIQLGSIYGYAGTFALNLAEIPRPANDDFADATSISTLPFSDTQDLTAATTETGEPTASCAWDIGKSVWYKFRPSTSGSYSVDPGYSAYGTANVYTGTGLGTLTSVLCGATYSGLHTFHAVAGTTYYLQAGTPSWSSGSFTLGLEVAPLPTVGFGWSPSDASLFDTLSFSDGSSDPANLGITSWSWNFGDGATTTERYPQHNYPRDGDYSVALTVKTDDGRTNSATQVVQVRTHDVAIFSFQTPAKAQVGKTAAITVGIGNTRYAEQVQVELYKSTPGGYQLIDTQSKSVPVMKARRTVDFAFNYTFTGDDLAVGKVAFRAVATIQGGGRDAQAADNTATSTATQVSK